MLEALNNYAQLINFVLLLAIIGFLIQLTVAYRSNVKEQTATLEQRLNLLREQLEEARAKDALTVAKSLEERVTITEREIERVLKDNAKLKEALHILADKIFGPVQEIVEWKNHGYQELQAWKDINEILLNEVGIERALELVGEEKFITILGEEDFRQIFEEEDNEQLTEEETEELNTKRDFYEI